MGKTLPYGFGDLTSDEQFLVTNGWIYEKGKWKDPVKSGDSPKSQLEAVLLQKTRIRLKKQCQYKIIDR